MSHAIRQRPTRQEAARVAARPVVIYYSSACGYCVQATALLQRHGIEAERVSVDGREDLRCWLSEQSGQDTVPQLFIDGRSIGGFQELQQLELDGWLEERFGVKD